MTTNAWRWFLCFGASIGVVCAIIASPVGGKQVRHAAKGYEVSYPDDWYVNQGVLDLGGPILISNVPVEEFLHGGVLPPGGAEISIQIFDGSRKEEDLLDELYSGPDRVKWQENIAGRSAQMVRYSYQIAGESITVVTACVRVGENVFRVGLLYPEDGSRPQEWMSVLREVIRTVKADEAKE